MRGTVRARSLGLLCLLTGCEVGLPVVGMRPEGPPPAEDQCFETRCAEVWAGPVARWEADESTGIASERCLSRRTVELSLAGEVLVEARDLRCTDLELVGLSPFTLDLRNVPLAGARVRVTSDDAGTITLPSDVRAIELSVSGPVDVVMAQGALGSSRIELTGSAPDRLASLSLDRVLVTEVVIDAPHGALRANRSVLTRVVLDAVEASLELSGSWQSSLRVERLSLLDAELRETDVESEDLVAAAGRLEEVDVRRCGAVTLASADVLRSRIARCTRGVVLHDADVERTLVEADLTGEGQIRQCGLAGSRVALENSRVVLTSLCGVQSFTLEGGALECPSCEPVPAEICGVAPTVEPHCPGFEAAPCEGRPRPPGPPASVAP